MEPRTPEEWARTLKAEWEERSASRSRDFFIASHAGWNVPEEWERQAEADARTMVAEFDQSRLIGADVLDLGCGIGRLAPFFARRSRTYTGVDISPGLLEEARRRITNLINVRFLENDGLTLPGEVRDREYLLIFAQGVFIHCPRDVIRSLLKEALTVLAPAGELRFQVLADYNDLEGIVSFEAAGQLHEAAADVEHLAVEDRHLTDERHYAGARFSYAEARAFLEGLGPVKVDLVRLDRIMIYARLVHRRADTDAG
jgi:SAM-dependent methyltransferase